jgi:hypothetical protein
MTGFAASLCRSTPVMAPTVHLREPMFRTVRPTFVPPSMVEKVRVPGSGGVSGSRCIVRWGPSAGFSVCTAKYSPQKVPSMALSQSVVSELLEAFRAGEGVDLIRESVQLVLQDLIETEAAERIGADGYERTDTRVTDRNGSRPRLLATQAGDVQLRIPKLPRARSSR